MKLNRRSFFKLVGAVLASKVLPNAIVSNSPAPIPKPVIDDSFSQKGTMGWKMWQTYRILNDDFIYSIVVKNA